MDNRMRAGQSRHSEASRGLGVDLGTLWTMGRDGYVTRCGLIWRPCTWELRVLIDDDVLLSEQYGAQAEVLTVADAWRTRLRRCGWTPLAAGNAGSTFVADGASHLGANAPPIREERARRMDQVAPGRARRQRGAKPPA